MIRLNGNYGKMARALPWLYKHLRLINDESSKDNFLHIINTGIFVATIFRRLIYRGNKFSWVSITHKNSTATKNFNPTKTNSQD